MSWASPVSRPPRVSTSKRSTASASWSPSIPTRRRGRPSATRSPMGRSDPVSTIVVVAVDQHADRPINRRSPIPTWSRFAPAGSTSVPVLDNDYDPEAGPLQVVSATAQPGVEATPGLLGRTLDITRRADRDRQLHTRLRRGRRGGATHLGAGSSTVRIVPPARPTGRRSPGSTSPTAAPVRRSRSRC